MRRPRENRYPTTVIARVPQYTKDRLEALADQELISTASIVRRAIEAGLPIIEKGEVGARQSSMEQACYWWEGLNNDQRRNWQQRVAPLSGREMIAESWKQAHGMV